MFSHPGPTSRRAPLRLAGWLALLACLSGRAAQPPTPFGVTGELRKTDGESRVRFQFTVPAEHILYADRLKFETEGGDPLEGVNLPLPVVFVDPVSEHEKKGYTNSFAAEVRLAQPLPLQLLVKYQGCSNGACYFPEKKLFRVTDAEVVPLEVAARHDEAASAALELRGELERFKVVARESGYLKKSDFLNFIEKSKSGEQPTDPLAKFRTWGLPATLSFILLGGVGLNLTPCVLPMIPINLAIMMGTAGARVRSRRRGFVLGSSYASGMALAYGVLGLGVVLTGAKFGTLNSSPWFNVGIAAVFVGLALAMFDVFQIDLTRFQSSVNTTRLAQWGQFPFVFVLGGITALLAGACVAPVVIAVLLLSAQMYADGKAAGLLLPLVLGVGMASPWPLAGAGMACFPKPGRWMVWVKRAFGVVILAMAAYYGHLALNLAGAGHRSTALTSAPGGEAPTPATSNDALLQALLKARQEGQLVFIDFGAAWCKNCVAMDETVFSSSEVKDKLGGFIFVRYKAERPNEAPAKDVLDHFGVMGLPTYVVLTPKNP
jgi:thioredoxin:protein disulfide reductase